MRSVLLPDVEPILQQAWAPNCLETVRALCHDPRQSLTAISLLARIVVPGLRSRAVVS